MLKSGPAEKVAFEEMLKGREVAAEMYLGEEIFRQREKLGKGLRAGM